MACELNRVDEEQPLAVHDLPPTRPAGSSLTAKTASWSSIVVAIFLHRRRFQENFRPRVTKRVRRASLLLWEAKDFHRPPWRVDLGSSCPDDKVRPNWSLMPAARWVVQCTGAAIS
jgi:hypothetical protein